ncbi:MAG: hypothetical protein LBS67_06295 [Clostridiales Family XIII bacterium]|jgi:hypothetical protein|nr:hypothetical protein [Clostridiales Family XIII bacterium]
MAEKLRDRYGNEFERLKLMVSIVARGQGNRVVKELRDLGVTFNMESVAYAAIGSDLADIFGLTESDCEIVFSVVTDSKVKAVMSMVEYKFSLDDPGTGLAFCVPLTGVGGPLSLKYISGIDTKKGGKQAESATDKDRRDG